MNDVAWALQTARKVGPIHPPHAHAHPIHKAHLTHTGPLRSHVAGRTDHLPSQVPNGSFVLPADIVSGLGEGNTEAGFKIAKRMFEGARRHFGGLPYAGDNGPYGQGAGGPYLVGRASGGIVVRGRAEGGSLGQPQPIEGIMAYHGSPHQFDQFDASKIGTGEGAQAYGHGLYFAQNENVAKQYRDKLAPQIPVKLPDTSSPFKNVEILEARPDLGHMYQVRIRAHPDHFLDWDKPLSEQSEHVRRAVDRIATGVLGRPPNYDRLAQAESGAGLHSWLSALTKHGGREGQEHASDALRQHGVRGIRYLDQGSRIDPMQIQTMKTALSRAEARGDTAVADNLRKQLESVNHGTHNYVVFDPKDIQIMRRYAQGGDVEADQQAVPVAVAGGEHVLAPHEVAFAGLGDTEAGHKALEAFVLRQRAKLIKTLKGLPGPSRD